MLKRLQNLGEWILRTRFPAIPILAGVLLTSPSLWVGLVADDLHIRSTVTGTFPDESLSRPWWDPYSYLDGNAKRTHAIADRGWMPWWTDPECKTALSRPLTAVTFLLDYTLWPDHPVFMHAQSLVWYAALIWAVAMLYRRMMGRSGVVWTAGVATLLFAVDEAHALPVGWLANRNALLAAFFGVATLIAFDRWRLDGWRLGAWLAPLSFAAALCAKEGAVATGGYLFAYVLFVDRGRWRSRAAALIPCAAVGAIWFAIYKSMGYGVFASEVYIDPANDPGRFLARVVRNGPILMLAQWGLPPSDISLFWSPTALAIHWAWAIVFTGLLAWLFLPLLRRDAVARFWCLGMTLSIVPVCAIWTNDRLLMFAGIGAMGLLALWFGVLLGPQHGSEQGTPWRGRLTRWVAPILVGIHLILAPVLLAPASISMRLVGRMLDGIYDTLPTDAAFAEQSAVFVNSIGALADMVWIQTRLADGRPVPIRSLTLAPACTEVMVTRTDDRTLVVRPVGGFFQPRGLHRPGTSGPVFSFRYHARILDMCLRSFHRPMPAHEPMAFSLATITVIETTDDDRPAAVQYRFHKPLEDPSLRFLAIRNLRYLPFIPPAVGEPITVPDPLNSSMAAP